VIQSDELNNEIDETCFLVDIAGFLAVFLRFPGGILGELRKRKKKARH